MTTITLRSRILSALFTFFIGHPSSLKMPAEFAYVETDRPLPGPNDLNHERKVKRIYVDHVRRTVTQRVGMLMMVVAVLFTAVTTMLGSAANGLGHLFHHGMGAAALSSTPALSPLEQSQISHYLSTASIPMCNNLYARRQDVQAMNPGKPVPPVLVALIQGCEDKFGNQLSSTSN